MKLLKPMRDWALASPLLAAAGLALALALLAFPMRVGAACGSLTADFVARAEIAFVGTLTEVTRDGSRAVFATEDVWRGEGLSIGAASPPIFSDPGFFVMPPDAAARRFVVLARVAGDQLLTGDDCNSNVYPWEDGYAALRPADAPPLNPPATGLPWPVVAVAGAAAVLLLVGGFAFRLRPGDRAG